MPQNNKPSTTSLSTFQTEATETPQVQAPIATPKTKAKFIKSISDDFTPETTVKQQYEALMALDDLSEDDADQLAYITPIWKAEKAAKIAQIRSVTSKASESIVADIQAQETLAALEHTKNLQRIKAESEAKAALYAPLTDKELEDLAINAARLERQKWDSDKELELAAREVQNVATKKRNATKLNRLANQAAAALPSQVELTEAGRQLMPGQQVEMTTTNHNGQEVTIEAVTVL